MDAHQHGPGQGDLAQRLLRRPVQTDCEFANPCLDCRFFITTRDFLDQHRRQREETHRLIADAETAGLARVAEKNTRTAAKLDTIIGALEHTAAGQIVRFQTAATRRSTGPIEDQPPGS